MAASQKSVQTQSGTNAGATEQIIRASNAWAEAIQKDDYDALDRLLADDFTTIQMTGNGAVLLSKQQQISGLRQSAPARARASRVLQNAKVRIHGPVGILTAIAVYANQGRGGTVQSQAIISEVWVNEAGSWRLTHFQATTAPRRIGG